jgi:hypothetical protein
MEYSDEKIVLSNLAQIEKTILNDISGSNARQIIDYYEKLSLFCSSQNDAATFGTDWQPELQIIDGMKATQRIVQKVWEVQHSKTLNL